MVFFSDQIAINVLTIKAMEHWGLITYQEDRLLWDPEMSTLYEKQRASGTIAHELVHQVAAFTLSTMCIIKYKHVALHCFDFVTIVEVKYIIKWC